MADPRYFVVSQAAPPALSNTAQIAGATSARREFFGALGKLGDLKVLNDVGGGKIGRGLRNLASISNSIRTGSGALPTSIGSNADRGTDWVLGAVGITAGAVAAVNAINPGVANTALETAKGVYENVKAGRFSVKNIPQHLTSLQNLERLARGIYTPGRGESDLTIRAQASPYVKDIVARHAKSKFLFIVEFLPAQGFEALNTGMAFVVKTANRPSPKFVYEEVNYYNFRSKALVRTEFEDATMTFHDDHLNTAIDFYHRYVSAMIPITNISPDAVIDSQLEDGGMGFDRILIEDARENGSGGIEIRRTNQYSASTGPLEGDVKHIFQKIVVYHLYDAGRRMNVWNFINPRITSLSMSELDMSSSDGSELSMSFNYDSVILDPAVNLAEDTSYNIVDKQPGAAYPLRYNGDVTGGSNTLTGLPDPLADFPSPVDELKNSVPNVTPPAVKPPEYADDLSNKYSKGYSGFSSFA